MGQLVSDPVVFNSDPRTVVEVTKVTFAYECDSEIKGRDQSGINSTIKTLSSVRSNLADSRCPGNG